MSKPFKRGGAWWINFYDEQGVRHRKKVGGSKRVAEEVLVNIQDKVNRGLYLGVLESTSRVTFTDFATQWLASRPADLAPRSRSRFAVALGHLVEHFKGPMRAITPDQVRQYVDARVAAGRAVNTINQELDVLMMVVRAAVKAKVLARNPLLDADGKPAEGAQHLKGAVARVRYLGPDEVVALLEACRATPYLEAFVLTSLNTGMRRDEVLSLTYAGIDRDNRLVRLVKTKTGEPRVVHFNPVAFAALEGLPRRLDGKLWPFTSAGVTMAFTRAVRRSGIVDFHLHDCRHHFASMHAMAGVNQAGLMRLLGHTDSKMTLRYAHLDDSYARAAIDRLQVGATPAIAAKTA
jgi:integrase